MEDERKDVCQETAGVTLVLKQLETTRSRE